MRSYYFSTAKNIFVSYLLIIFFTIRWKLFQWTVQYPSWQIQCYLKSNEVICSLFELTYWTLWLASKVFLITHQLSLYWYTIMHTMITHNEVQWLSLNWTDHSQYVLFFIFIQASGWIKLTIKILEWIQQKKPIPKCAKWILGWETIPGKNKLYNLSYKRPSVWPLTIRVFNMDIILLLK